MNIRCTLMQLPPLKPKLTIILGKKDRNGQKIVQRSLSTSAKLGCCPAKKLYCFCLLVSQILCPRSISNTFNLFVPKKIESYFPKRKKGEGWNLNFFWVSWTHWWCLMGGHNSHAFYFAFQISSYHLFHACAGGLLLSTYVPSRQHFLRTVFCLNLQMKQKLWTLQPFRLEVCWTRFWRDLLSIHMKMRFIALQKKVGKDSGFLRYFSWLQWFIPIPNIRLNMHTMWQSLVLGMVLIILMLVFWCPTNCLIVTGISVPFGTLHRH